MRVSGRPIRVLQVIGALYFGGAEKVVASLALGVDRSRFEMAVCLTRGFGPLSEAVRAGGDSARSRRCHRRACTTISRRGT